MSKQFSVFRDPALMRFDLPERALLIRLRYLAHLLHEGYHSLKRCRSAKAFYGRLRQLAGGPIPELFPDLGKRLHALLAYREKGDHTEGVAEQPA